MVSVVVRILLYFVFRAFTLALQQVFAFVTDGHMDTMCENNDHRIRPWPGGSKRPWSNRWLLDTHMVSVRPCVRASGKNVLQR